MPLSTYNPTTKLFVASPTAIFVPGKSLTDTDLNTALADVRALISGGGGGGGPPLATTTPPMDGIAAIGVSTSAARADHVHPLDTSRAPLLGPAFTGVPTVPTASPGTNTAQAASTAFVAAAVVANSGSVLPITSTYTVSGAIAPTDLMALVDGVATCSMTLAAGTVNGQRITIKRYGVGTVTVTLKLDGSVDAVITANDATIKEAISLDWSTVKSTWLAV